MDLKIFDQKSLNNRPKLYSEQTKRIRGFQNSDVVGPTQVRQYTRVGLESIFFTTRESDSPGCRPISWPRNALKRRDSFPFYSPGDVTYRIAHRASPLLSTPVCLMCLIDDCAAISAMAAALVHSVAQ